MAVDPTVIVAARDKLMPRFACLVLPGTARTRPGAIFRDDSDDSNMHVHHRTISDRTTV